MLIFILNFSPSFSKGFRRGVRCQVIEKSKVQKQRECVEGDKLRLLKTKSRLFFYLLLVKQDEIHPLLLLNQCPPNSSAHLICIPNIFPQQTPSNPR